MNVQYLLGGTCLCLRCGHFKILKRRGVSFFDECTCLKVRRNRGRSYLIAYAIFIIISIGFFSGILFYKLGM